MKPHTLLFLAILILSITASHSQTTDLPKAEKIHLAYSDLTNLYQIDDGVYRSDQPNSRGFKALETYGIKEVLSLRNWNSDTDEAKNTNITLHRLKTRASKIDQNDIIAALTIIQNRRGPILIHCWHGSDRTGAVSAMYRIVFQNWSKQNAINEMLDGGFGFHEQFMEIVDMINASDINHIKKELAKTKIN